MVADFCAEHAIVVGDSHSSAALPICGAAQQLAATIPHFVNVVGRHMQVGEVEHYVVAHIFGVLHGAKHGIGAAVEHYVERAEVAVTLVSQGEQDDQRGRGQLHQQYGGDEAEGDAAASCHAVGSSERR